MRLKSFVLFCSALLFCGSALFAETLHETVKRQVEFAEHGLVILENVNGKVVVEGWDQPEVYIEAEKRVKSGNEQRAHDYMQKLKVEIDVEDDRIRIKTRHPRGSGGGGFLDWLFDDNVSANVYYTVRVPLKTNLDLSNTNGAIEVENVQGELEISTTNGKIIAENVGGEVRGHSTNGSIDAELVYISEREDVEFSTTNGSIRLYLPEESGFDMDARTTNGSISSDFAIRQTGKYTRKRMSGSVNGGGPRLTLETTNGSIHVREL